MKKLVRLDDERCNDGGEKTSLLMLGVNFQTWTKGESILTKSSLTSRCLFQAASVCWSKYFASLVYICQKPSRTSASRFWGIGENGHVKVSVATEIYMGSKSSRSVDEHGLAPTYKAINGGSLKEIISFRFCVRSLTTTHPEWPTRGYMFGPGERANSCRLSSGLGDIQKIEIDITLANTYVTRAVARNWRRTSAAVCGPR